MTKNIISLVSILMLANLTSCGGKNSSSAVAPKPIPTKKEEPVRKPVPPVVEKEEFDPGEYEADLKPVNPGLVSSASGKFSLTIREDVFSVEAEVAGVHGGMKHFQAVHVGGECPDENADTNFDQVIDAQEVSAFSGNTLVPLDSHLNTQVEGLSYGPIANEEGYYFYRRSTSYNALMEDLLSYDDEPEDDLAKLVAPDRLKANEKVIIVYGVSPDTALAETVKSRGELPVHESVPVLCGKLKRVTP